jgi:hypothetical protein
MLDRQAQGDHAAEREAQDVHPLEPEGPHHGRQVVAHGDGVDRTVGQGGAAVAIEVDGDHLAPFGQTAQHRAEHVQRAEPAVQQQQGRRPFLRLEGRESRSRSGPRPPRRVPCRSGSSSVLRCSPSKDAAQGRGPTSTREYPGVGSTASPTPTKRRAASAPDVDLSCTSLSGNVVGGANSPPWRRDAASPSSPARVGRTA